MRSRQRVALHSGEVIKSIYPDMLPTVHPSSILRAPDDESRPQAIAQFIRDLQAAVEHLRR